MFSRVLVANRGEIAVRIIATLRRLGIASVAVHADDDEVRDRHVVEADSAVRLTGRGYLDPDAVVAAAVRTGAEAIHPGYGFLSESAGLARACAAAGVVFVGPSVPALEVMGDKISARRAVEARGVPTVPGLARPGLTDAELTAGAMAVRLPLLVKPAAGGGGKGMHLVTELAELMPALRSARREAAAAFGDDTLFLERFVPRPRHLEVQVLADAHGHIVHLGERECSLQRRHQKVIEEAPAPRLTEPTRERLCAAAIETARSVDYTGVGTVEFIVSADAPGDVFFLEMNTRLQVEHPVTELVTGLDLVEWQLRVAAGEPLGFEQADVRRSGHAIEARVYAEDPRCGFLPTGGTVLGLAEPADAHVRVDSGLSVGMTVSTRYDPMLAKIIAWGEDRATALSRLDDALSRTAVPGVINNLAFLRLLLADPDVRAGELDTGLIERRLPELIFPELPDFLVVTAALHLLSTPTMIGSSLWDQPSGWRLTGPAPTTVVLLDPQGARHIVAVTGSPIFPATAAVRIGDGEPAPAQLTQDGTDAMITIAGESRLIMITTAGDVIWLHDRGGELGTWALTHQTRHPRSEGSRTGLPELRSPLPGTVVAVLAEDGAVVAAGDPLLVVEAMKMEHALAAPVAGRVRLHTGVGRSVKTGELLASLASEEES